MKKSLLLALSTFMLMGCSQNSYPSSISEKNDVMVSGSKINITKEDFYQSLMEQNGANEVLKIALSKITDKEITDKNAIDQLLKEKKKTYAQYYDGDLKQYAQALGFKTEQEFIENQLIPEVKEELLRNKYISKNYDKLLKEYHIANLKYISVQKESQALDLMKNINDEKSFDKIAKDSKYKVEDCGIVTKNSQALDKNLAKKLDDISKMSKDGLYKDAIELSNGQYAIIFVKDTAHKDQKAFIQALSNDNELRNDIESYYLKEYDFKVYDNKLEDDIKEISSDFIE